MSENGKGAFYLTVSTFAFMVAGYVVNVWLGHRFGPDIYGLYGTVISLMTLVNIMQTSGLPQALAKHIAEDPEHSEDLLRTSLLAQAAMTVIAGGVFALLAPVLSLALHDTRLIPYLRLTGLVFPAYGLFSIFVGYYNGKRAFKKQAAMNIVYALAKIAGVVGLTMLFQLYGAVLAFAVVPVFVLLFFGHLPRSHAFAPRAFKKLMRLSLPIILSSLTTMLFFSLDLLFVKALLNQDPKATGYYVAAQNIALILFYGMSAVGSVVFPNISHHMAKEQNEKGSELVTQSVRYVLIILALGCALMIATSQALIDVLYSRTYLAAAMALPALLLAYTVLSVTSIFANTLNGSNKPYAALKAAAAGVLLAAVLYPLLIPDMGIAGAALATFAGAIASCLYSLYYVRRTFSIGIKLVQIVRILGCAAAVYGIARLVQPPLILLPLEYAAAGVVYLVLLVILQELKPADLQLAKAMVLRSKPQEIPLP